MVSCIPVLSCQLHQGLIAHGEHLTSRCQGWISDGRKVLHFKPLRYNRWSQALEVTLGDFIPGEPAPLHKRRRELTREQAIKLWGRKRQEGWRACPPQWVPPRPLRP